MIEILQLGQYVPKEMLRAMGEQKVLDAILGNIAEAARAHWVKLAQETFHRTRRDYVNGIQPVRMRSGEAVITLVGGLPNALEQGQSPYEMQSTLLGPNVATVPRGFKGKHRYDDQDALDGDDPGVDYYRAIPFRHLPPGSKSMLGEVMGKALTAAYGEKKARAMGRAIYAEAKALAPTKSVYGDHPGPAPDRARMVYGDAPLPPGAQGPERPWRLDARALEARYGPDVARIYGGMIREEKKYAVATQSKYVTFRTISTRGEPWNHPGLPARNLASQVTAFAGRIAQGSFEAFAKGARGE